MRRLIKKALVVILLALTVAQASEAGASTRPAAYNEIPSPVPTWPATIYVSKYAIRCVSQDQPRQLSPTVYSVNGIGSPGVLKLDRDKIKLIAGISKHLGARRRDLHFVLTHVKLQTGENVEDFKVFEAPTDKICFLASLPLLNFDPVGQYEPAEDRFTPMMDHDGWDPYPWPVVMHPKIVHVGRYGIACAAEHRPSEIGPPSYRYQDYGKPGVPKLKPEEIRLAQRVQHFLHADDLRFTLLTPGHYDRSMRFGHFLLYRAAEELVCASGYQFAVLSLPVRASYFPRVEPLELYNQISPEESYKYLWDDYIRQDHAK